MRKCIKTSGMIFGTIMIVGMLCSCTSMRHTKNNVYLGGEPVGHLNEEELIQRIRKHSEPIKRTPCEPQMNEYTWEVSPSTEGLKVDEEKTLSALLNAKEGEKVDLFTQVLKPQKEERQMKQNIVEIGRYTTPLVDRDKDRIKNIHIAAEAIDGYQILPDAEFSYNEVVGKRTEKKGYEKAPILLKTTEGSKKTLGVGGGICQVSSTLYSTAEQCGLKITERHPHSKNVSYAKEGKDATVAYGSLDLKFINTREHPIMIKVLVGKTAVAVTIVENRNG